MDETIIFPSPNWFLPSGLAVSTDEWIVYGGPSKSLCVLEPLPKDYNKVVKIDQAYTAHVVNKAHFEKITCVDICPEWPEKRCLLSGSADGTVKQWSLEQTTNALKIKSTHSHEIHHSEKEEVVGVGYCQNGYAVTVGNFGHIVKWDLNSNVAKSFNHVLKSFKPVCMACSPHIHMQVAIGTKQGVLFVLDLNGAPRIIYKVRGQDDEILKVSWCPQYEVAVRKALKESGKRNNDKKNNDKQTSATLRMEKIQQEPETPENIKILDERVKNSQTTDQPIKINEKSEPIIEATTSQEVLDESGIGKTLPEDSFDETVIQEDDMFDIYKDHEADEFGHKKFQPIDVVVTTTEEPVKEDFLSDCQKLKDEILQRKAQAEAPIGDLVEALDKSRLEDKANEPSTSSKSDPPVEGKITKGEVESSVHIHKHLLATIGKQGSIRVWSKSGKMVGSCAVFGGVTGGKNQRNQKAVIGCTTLLWCEPDSLFIADGKSQLLECNPLKIDCKNKLEWRVVHTGHSRGLFAIAGSAPRVQAPAPPHPRLAVWTAAQDRCLIRYDARSQAVVVRHTAGGFIYTVKPCPYDASRVSLSAGDGTVRVWEAEALSEGHGGSEEAGAGAEAGVGAGRVLRYWQNVQGKVLVTAWHPEREHLLAFATAESRVGLLDTRRGEGSGRVLAGGLAGPVYSLCWAEGAGAGPGEGEGAWWLYACAAGAMVRYRPDKPDEALEPVSVLLDGAPLEVTAVCVGGGAGGGRGLAVGGAAGVVALLDQQHQVRAAAFVFNKSIHTIDWHPQHTSDGCDPDPYGDLLAVCSMDRAYTVVLLQYTEKEDGSCALGVWKTLAGHSGQVLQVCWSPHRSEHLLSTSQDGTVTVWDVTAGSKLSIFGGHGVTTLGAAWGALPGLRGAVLSGGGDCCLRLWTPERHPAAEYREIKHETAIDKKNKKNRREKKGQEKAEDGEGDAEGEGGAGAGAEAEGAGCAVVREDIRRRYNKKFLLPILTKQLQPCDVRGPRYMWRRYLENSAHAAPTAPAPAPAAPAAPEYGLDYLKLFGNINQLNEVLDAELERHQDTGAEDSWAVLNIVRGYIDHVIQRAAARDALDPFLLSVAPAVSFKYWKDATLLYLQQIDRLQAKGEESKLTESKLYGGAVYRRVVTQLSLHDVLAAVTTLLDAKLHKEAYVLSRIRYMESMEGPVLREWAAHSLTNSQYNLAGVCYIALGELSQAAAALGRSPDEDTLSLAAEIAKVIGQTTFASRCEEKIDQIKTKRDTEERENLKPLPTRTELELNNAGEDVIDEDNGSVKESLAPEKVQVEIVEAKEVADVDQTESVKKQFQIDSIEDRGQMESAIGELETAQVEIENAKGEIGTVKGEIGTATGEIGTAQGETESVIDTETTNVSAVGQFTEVGPDKTEELLQQLPKKLEGLMKEPLKVEIHRGDGDSAQNGLAQDIHNQASNNGDLTQASVNGDGK